MTTSLQQVSPRVREIRPPTAFQNQGAGIKDELMQGAGKPLKTVIDVKSCDPHRAGMAPNSFVRKVLAACMYPKLLKEKSLPPDARQRAQMLLGVCNGGTVGSYCPTPYGIPYVHKSIAEFINRRDGGERSDPENIIISTGFEKTLWMVLHLMSSEGAETQTGVLIPMPCPHTLPMLLNLTGLAVVPYQLMEDQAWALDLGKLHQALKTARGYCEPRAIFISNPGNPTGHVQDRKSIKEVIDFAATEGLLLLVEEVYQDSVYGQDKDFISYNKVLFEMGRKYSETVELISFNALSCASMGECGLRGGYMDVINMDPPVKKYLKNMMACSTPPVLPQLALEVMVNPPSPGDPSYEIYKKEILHTQMTLSQNAKHACEFLNDLPGMSCQPAMAGVFLYTHLHLPHRMIDEAKMLGIEADALYCQWLLNEEGVCLGAGCENGQNDQHYYIRLCILVPDTILDELLARLRSFHLRLLERFD